MNDIKSFNHYFYFDLPIPFQLRNNVTIEIKPVSLSDSELFLNSVDILRIDKNSLPSVEIIQMSYLEFLDRVFLNNNPNEKLFRAKFSIVLNCCLGISEWKILYNEKNKPFLYDKKALLITAKEFEKIIRIILYQNIPHYDDTYINPDLKKAMQEQDNLKMKNIEFPNLERKMAIITAHCGLPKSEQIKMTLRSHSLLFEEVCGEIEFTTVRPIALFGGDSDKLDHWIYPKVKGKFDGYITSIEQFNKSMGGNGVVQTKQI